MPREEGTTTRLRPAVVVGALLAPLVLIVAPRIAGRHGFGPVDDAFISLRYAANWAGGRGLVFNPGEVVEGYTNFLLVALEAAAIGAGFEPVAVMRGIGWLSLAALALVTYVFLERKVMPGRALASGLLTLALVLNPAFVAWASSGMETCLYTALLVAAVLAAVGLDGRSRPVAAGLLMMLAALTRPEAVALALVVGLIVWLGERRPAAVRSFAIWFAVPYGLYFLARWWHFGWLLPNTFYAKLDYGGVALLARGLRYAWSFAMAVSPLVVLAVAAVFMLRRAPVWVKGSALVVAAQFALVIWEGGDHFAMYRFLMPALPFLALLALHALERAAGGRVPERWESPAVVAAGLVVLLVSAVTIGQPRMPEEPDVTQRERFALEASYARNWAGIGRWLRVAAPPDASLATVAIGAIGFFSDLTVVDPHGIVDPEIAHLEVELGDGPAGHEKYDVDAVLARRPDYILLVNWMTPAPQPLEAVPGMVWGSFNRDILQHPELESAYRYASVQMGGRAFLNLHVREGAPTPSAERSWMQRMMGTEAGPGFRLGRWHLAPDSATPAPRAEAAARERLLALPYLRGSRAADTTETGVTLLDPERAWEGLNLYNSGHAPRAYLTTMDGRVLHEWHREITDVWPDFEPPQNDDEQHHLFWRRVKLLPDGRLWAIFEGIGLVLLDRDSEVLFAERGGYHHQLVVDEKGWTWALNRRRTIDPRINRRRPILEDLVTVKDPQHRTVRHISLVDAFLESDYAPLLTNVWSTGGDIFHTNSLVLLDGGLESIAPAFRDGNLLISIRHLDTLAVLDPESERIVWAQTGMWHRQHDPSLLADGGMLLFDNLGRDGASRVLEFDPLTREVRWRFTEDPRHPFHSETCGTAQRLPNGNTLITETDAGHAFEVTRDQEIVWEFLSPHRAGDNGEYVASLFEVSRLPAEAGAAVAGH